MFEFWKYRSLDLMLMTFLLICNSTLIREQHKQNLLVCYIITANYSLWFLLFIEFSDVTYRKIVHNISVRWLSLQAAVDRALQQYSALCSFSHMIQETTD